MLQQGRAGRGTEMALSIEDQISNLADKMTDLAAQNRKDGIADARELLAARLIEMVSGTEDNERNLRECMTDTEWSDYMITPDFRAGVRWAAAMITEQDVDY